MADGRDDFGAVVRAWRDRLSPADAGVSRVRARRARGLRREELAGLAGISVDYLTRLEQGRARKPSAEVVAALARALQLDVAERDHLYRTAGLLAPQPGQISCHVPAGVQRLITRLGNVALGVFSADWTLIQWTPLWASLIGDPVVMAPLERNLIRAVFGAHVPPSIVPVRSERGEGALEAALVADLRTAAGAYPNDRGLQDLITWASETSSRFAELWDSAAVGYHVSDRKTIAHPLVGELTLDCDVLAVPGADLKIVVYTAAADTPDAEKLDFLRTVGTHAFPESHTSAPTDR